MTRPSVSDAYSFAIAASASVIVPQSSRAAARNVSSSAASSSVAMSAIWNPMPWNDPIGRPNCPRREAHSAAVSSTRRARPMLVAATVSRLAPSHRPISSKPRPSSPSRLATGTRQPVNTSLALVVAAIRHAPRTPANLEAGAVGVHEQGL